MYFYGPFRFNWWRAHATQWARGDDAAGYLMPFWGDGGEPRARKEYGEAKDKALKQYWHYQKPKKTLDAERAAIEKAKAEATA